MLERYSRWTFWTERVKPALGMRADRPAPPPSNRGIARRLTDDEVTELVEHYRDGATVYDLASRFRIDRTTVSGHLHRRGVAMRSASMTEYQIDEAAELYVRGWSLARVGWKFGFHAETIRRALRGRGVEMRDPQGRERKPGGRS